jgi:hypothetical protein
LSKLSRTKGHDFERKIAQRFRVIFPRSRRQLEYNEMDCNGVDLADTGRYLIQCKRKKKYANPSAIAEIQVKDPSEIPVLITKADHKPPLAILPLEHLIELIAKYEGRNN